MKRYAWMFSLGLLLGLLPLTARAAIPAIQVSPLEYQDTLIGATSKLGFVDVANPTDTAVTLHATVEAFKQVNLNGDLQFYPDATVAAGITVSATDIQLGPQEADRIAFTIDPQKLPQGGVYAAIFFETVPAVASVNGNVIFQSARTGTLLILDNGGAGKKVGAVSRLQMPWLQWGNGLGGTIYYANTGEVPQAIAYNPTLAVKATWWGSKSYVNGPLVFPGNTRQFTFTKRGSYFGLVPLLLTDKDTGRQSVSFVFAITGFWRIVALLALMAVSVWAIIRFKWYSLAFRYGRQSRPPKPPRRV